MQKTFICSNIRRLILSAVAAFIFWMNGSAQCKDFTISVKGDTLNCTDVKDLKQGKWVVRVEEVRGEPGYEEEGIYKDGKKEGPWRVYSLMGDLLAIEFYRWGNKHGKQQYFNTMGDMVREESWLAQNPDKPTETVEVYDVNDPKKITLVEVKLEASCVPHGYWTIYEPGTGKVLRKENFILGKLDDGTGTANGIVKKDPNETTDPNSTTKKETTKEKAKPKEILEYEKKNSGKKKIKVRTGQTGG